MTDKTARYVPTIAKGRNMLGAIYMALREQIKKGKLNELNVLLTPVNQVMTIKHDMNRSKPTTTRAPPSNLSSANALPLRSLALNPPAPVPPPQQQQYLDPHQAYLQQQYPLQSQPQQQNPPQAYQQYAQQVQQQNHIQQMNAPVGQDYIATNQKYADNHLMRGTPVVYTEDERMNRVSNVPSYASQLPEIPAGRVPYQRTVGRTLEDVYNEQRQVNAVAKQSYAHIAVQNQDFSTDVDMCSGALSNVRPQQQNPRAQAQSHQPTFQGNYDWTW